MTRAAGSSSSFTLRRGSRAAALGQAPALISCTGPAADESTHKVPPADSYALRLVAGRRLYDAGVFISAVGYPTVPEGKARLRAIVTATHKRADLTRATEILADVGRSLGILAG